NRLEIFGRAVCRWSSGSKPSRPKLIHASQNCAHVRQEWQEGQSLEKGQAYPFLSCTRDLSRNGRTAPFGRCRIRTSSAIASDRAIGRGHPVSLAIFRARRSIHAFSESV